MFIKLQFVASLTETDIQIFIILWSKTFEYFLKTIDFYKNIEKQIYLFRYCHFFMFLSYFFTGWNEHTASM